MSFMNDHEDARRIFDLHACRGLTQEVVKLFRRIIYRFYHHHGRTFEWRDTQEPYKIVVSEIMLQQTQTQRVESKYPVFIAAFPDFVTLASASLEEVLRVWQGLGYNRRALALKRLAEMVVTKYQGTLPSEPPELRELPGIGHATSNSIAAFAFNKPTIFIETNIRSVFIHFFFPAKNGVNDSEILPLVEKTLDTKNPREWYFALMDYGVMLKRQSANPSRKSSHYQRQKPFDGSTRQLRGNLIRAIVCQPDISEENLHATLNVPLKTIKKTLSQLEKEGFICEHRGTYHIKKQ